MVGKSIGPEPINDILSQIPVPFLEGILAMKPAAAKQGNILNASTSLEEFLHNDGDRRLPVAIGLSPALYTVGKPDDNLLPRARQFS